MKLLEKDIYILIVDRPQCFIINYNNDKAVNIYIQLIFIECYAITCQNYINVLLMFYLYVHI